VTIRTAPVLVVAMLAAGLLFVSDPCSAQETSTPHSQHSRALCWRGKPLPECRSFLITEMGVMARLDDDPFLSDDWFFFTFDLGWMKNVSPREALGFSGYALAADTSRLGVRGRYRRWLSRHTAIDISPGILLSGEDPGVDYDPPGFVLGASANLGDLIALTLEAEYARFRDYGDGLGTSYDRRSDVTWRAGGKLGSGLGVLGTAALAGFIIYLASAGVLD